MIFVIEEIFRSSIICIWVSGIDTKVVLMVMNVKKSGSNSLIPVDLSLKLNERLKNSCEILYNPGGQRESCFSEYNRVIRIGK